MDCATLARRSCGCGVSIATVQPQAGAWISKPMLRPAGFGEYEAATVETAPDLLLVPADPMDSVCSMIFTSGTSGRPKAVMYTHRGLAVEGREMVLVERINSSDIFFVPSSIAHISGISFGLYMPLAVGCTVCVMPEWSAEAAVRFMEEMGCTWTAGPTPFLEGIVAAATARGRGPRGLRVFRCGGASVSPGLIRQARALGIDAYRCYGMSEHPTVSGHAGQPDEMCINSDGVIHPLAEVRIVDPSNPASWRQPAKAVKSL